MPLTASCALKTRIPYAFLISTIIFFVLPMTLILTLYFLIGLQLRKSSRQMGRTSTTLSTTLSVNTNSHHIYRHHAGSQHNRVVRDYESYSTFNHSMNQNSSHPDCNDSKHNIEEESEEPNECDRLTPPEVDIISGHHRKNNGKSSSMVKSNSLQLPNLSPSHATSSTSCTQFTPKNHGRKINAGSMSPLNGATSPIRGSSSPAMLTPTRSRLAIFSSFSQHNQASPVLSHPHLKASHLNNHSRSGSRTFSYNGGATTGGSTYRQHAASRRAVVKMLGKSLLYYYLKQKANMRDSSPNKSREGFASQVFVFRVYFLPLFLWLILDSPLWFHKAFCEASLTQTLPVLTVLA